MKDTTLEIDGSVNSIEVSTADVDVTHQVALTSAYEAACLLSSGGFVDRGGTVMTPLDDW